MIAFLIIILLCIAAHKNDYNYAYNYYFLSLYQTSEVARALPLAKKVKSVGGAGYLLSEGERQFVLAFALFDKSEAEKMKSQYSGFDAEVISLYAPQLSRRAARLLNTGVAGKVASFVSGLPKEVKEQIELFEAEASLRSIFMFFERQKEKICVFKEAIASATDGIEENYKNIFFGALDEIENSLKTCQDAVYKSEMVVSSLNYFLIETCLFSIKMRKNFA